MRKYLIIIIIILIFGISLGTIFLPRDFNSEKRIIFHIEKGQGSEEIAVNLEKEGLIWWGPIFRSYVFIRGMAGKLQVGYYSLCSTMNILQIAEKFVSGDIVKIKITIPEGFTSAQIAQKLKDVTLPGNVTWERYEGYLFPDTYEIAYGTEQEKIIEMMLNNFKKRTAGLKITPEIVIMASLLEKEVQTKEDKEIVSGIFWKRLKIGKPLESCATIAYIKGEDLWRYSFEDTRIESPYNTYLNLGLPPGPISNPGLESILSAIYPKNSEYWYYLSTSDGKTIFSKTLEEHNFAKTKYLK